MTLGTSVEKHDIPKRNMKDTCKFIYCEKVCSVPFIHYTIFLVEKDLTIVMIINKIITKFLDSKSYVP